MKIGSRRRSLRLALGLTVVMLMLPAGASFGQDNSGQPAPAQQPAAKAPSESAAGNEVALTFDLNICENIGPGLYQCPSSYKPMCEPGYNKGDVRCLRVDENGVLLQQGM